MVSEKTINNRKTLSEPKGILGLEYKPPLLFTSAIALVYLFIMSTVLTLFIISTAALIPAIALTGIVVVVDYILSQGGISPLVSFSALLIAAVVSPFNWIVDRLNTPPQTDTIKKEPTTPNTTSLPKDAHEGILVSEDSQASTSYRLSFFNKNNEDLNKSTDDIKSNSSKIQIKA